MLKPHPASKACVYCRFGDVPLIGEHVFSRKLFHVRHRHRLPKVPGCEACNTAKSQLENYVMAAMPLGANHPSARAYAEEHVERRLASNLPLRRDIVQSMERGEDGLLRYSADSTKLLELLLMTSKGLFAYHFGRPLHHHWEPRIRHVAVGQEAEAIAVLAALVGPDPESVHRNLGEGTMEYWGQRSHRMPQCSAWRFVPFGGLVWTGNPEAPGERYSTILCATMRREDAPVEIDPEERHDWAPTGR
jgi:hypothetical protein